MSCPLSSAHKQNNNNNINTNMLMSYPGYNHHTAIRTPPRVSSPKLASLSLAESSTKPPPSPLGSSLLVMDQQGEIHDPSYLSTLRSLHAEIGARASPLGGRRMSSARPSQLGLGLSGRDVDRFQGHNFSSDDESDSDDDEDDLIRGDSYTSSILHGSSRADRSHSFSSPRSSHFPTPPRSPAFSSTLASVNQTPTSTYDDEGSSSKEKKERRASWSSRRREQSNKSNRSRSSTNQDVEAIKSEDWGFTGLVDLEREQRAARASMDQSRRESLQESRGDLAATEPSSPLWKSSRSLLRKDSAGSSGIKENQRKPATIRASHSGGSSGFWSLSHSKGLSSAMRRQSSLSSLQNNQLSTIISGRPMMTADNDSTSDRWSAVSERTTQKDGRKLCQIEAQLLEQQKDAVFLVGPSKYKQSKELLKKKTNELGEIASGVRFGALMTKKKIERSIKG